MSEQLRDFLRSRRAKITPPTRASPRTPHPGPRRVLGLRREEVAQLAGVSVDYYVRLERGRNLNVSESVLDASSRALQLNDLERTHLFTLAKPTRSRPRPLPPQRMRPGLQLVLDGLHHVPALVLGRSMDVLAANRLAGALYTDFDALPPLSRKMPRLIFLDDTVRALYADWEGAARGVVATLHLYAGRYPHDPALAELIGELLPARPGLPPLVGGSRRLRTHPRSQALPPPARRRTDARLRSHDSRRRPEQTLGITTVEPGSPSEERLCLLASWTSPAKVDS
ncbi:helix-turn-helix transcriptional regulator [Amycolatopsis sp. NPDC023774]|uniref:helix-turn-helix domain-containing protein n=1 Tax=Amycolatopsis sp. NPDC023774 TaxID=3155015 RepID=UPI0033F0BDFB